MKKRYNIDFGDMLVVKALKFFVDNPYGEVYLRDFGRKVGISPNSAQRFLNLFLKEGLVKEFRRANLRYFKANIESFVFRHIKISFSLKVIENSGFVNFLNENGASHVVLFGSVARGEDDKNSDLDVVYIGVKKKLDYLRYESKIGRELNVHFYSWGDWKKVSKENRAFYNDVMRDGINLIGGKPIVD